MKPLSFSLLFLAALAHGVEVSDQPVIPYEWQKHERELFGYVPDFPVGIPAFGPGNLPAIRDFPRPGVSLPGLHRLSAEGTWQKWPYDHVLSGTPGPWSNLPLYRLVFDKDGDAYLLVDQTGVERGRWILLHWRSGASEWIPYELPLGRMPGDYKGNTDNGNLAILEVPSGSQPLDHPPLILGVEQDSLVFVAPDKRKDGTLEIPAVRTITSLKGDCGVKFAEAWKAGWGGWGHGEPQRVATHGPWAFFVWARPVPVPPHTGTPMYIAAWSRESNIVTEPVFLGANGVEVDSHNMPVVAVDSRGIVHVVLGAHGTIENPWETCVYLRSKNPLDLASGFTPAARFPVPGTTYPSLVVGPDDALHFLVRRYEPYAFVDAGTFDRGYVLKDRQPPPAASQEFPILPRSQLLYLRLKDGEWFTRPLVRSFLGSYVFWGGVLTIDRKGNLYASYRYSPRTDLLKTPVAPAMLTSSDQGNNWHLAQSTDFLTAAGISGTSGTSGTSSCTPVLLGQESGTTSLGDLAWGFPPNAVHFSPSGEAWISAWPSESAGFPAFHKIEPDAAWSRIETRIFLPDGFQPGPWAKVNRHFPEFDASGRVYALADGTGSDDGKWTLLVSADNGGTWLASATPLGSLPGGFKTANDNNANFARLEGDPSSTKYPPVVLGNDASNLLLVDVRLDETGTPDFSRVVRLAGVEGDTGVELPRRSNAGWGGFNHDNSRRSVCMGDKVHIVFARPVAVPGSPGTPSYALTYDRVSGAVSEPVFLATSGIEIDGHNAPTICRDSRGYLHVVLGAHGPLQGQHPVYLRSEFPDSTASWLPPSAMASGTTYPIILCDSHDNLHVVSRGSNGNLVHDRKPAGGDWETQREIVRPYDDGRYALYYHALTLAPDGRLFLHFRPMNRKTAKFSPESDQKDYEPTVLVSEDDGLTWQPATPEALIVRSGKLK